MQANRHIGRNDPNSVKEWIRTCMPRNPSGERSLLVQDSFRAHLTESVKEALQRQNIDVAVIPGGLAPVLQPLEKCLNKPFIENMRREYLSWMITSPFEFNPAGKRKVASRNLFLRWIKQFWRKIAEEMVKKSFLTCGISNALDGTEDNAICEEEPDRQKMRWMKNLIRKAKMSHKPTPSIVQFTTKNKRLLQEPPHIKS